ncbi:HNH endonuclease [Salimicrobium sp. PL1-032A]|uniref:HNH endonuclease n=1 Tax=Salimicrobium sp. PL1-032A TaxID=3095364 RepID=UPI0032610922
MEDICELCWRYPVKTTEHHLIPKQHGGVHGPTAQLCSPCHRQIHALFSNQELARFYNRLERIQDHPDMKNYLKWIRKQDPAKRITTRKANRRK